MMRRLLLAATTVLAFLAGSPAIAHHSANAEFDTSKMMTITGTLKKLESVNPHSWWYIEVMGSDGKVTPWRLESNSPSGLIRLGLKVKTDVKVGDVMSFRISPAWKDPDGERMGWMRSVTVNGHEFVLTEL